MHDILRYFKNKLLFTQLFCSLFFFSIQSFFDFIFLTVDLVMELTIACHIKMEYMQIFCVTNEMIRDLRKGSLAIQHGGGR